MSDGVLFFEVAKSPQWPTNTAKGKTLREVLKNIADSRGCRNPIYLNRWVFGNEHFNIELKCQKGRPLRF